MHPRLESWLQKWRKQKKDNPPPPHERIPTLPSPRPRPITPTLDNGLVAQPQLQSPFFGKLPLELRQLIYGHLFGHRVVHVSLGYQYPRKPGGDGHAGWGTLGRTGHIMYYENESSGQRWTSQSSACCRDPARTYWWDDSCIVGHNTACSGNTINCTIAGSWLLTCRQAYLESIDTLDSTTTFHPRELAAPLPRALAHALRHAAAADKPTQLSLLAANLVPHRFALISRLHVRAHSPMDPPHPSYARLCRAVLALPALRSLRLAVDVRVARWAASGPAPADHVNVYLEVPAGPALDTAWLGVVDEMVTERPWAFVEFVVGESWWEVFNRRGAEVVQGCGGGDYRRFWRVVAEGEEERGYWVAGMPDPWVPALVRCFYEG